MPADEEEAKPLAERVVKEAVTVGLETPMREPILEAVEEAGEGEKDPARTVPMAGALLGLGAAAGYLLGVRGADFDAEDVPIDDFEEPDVINEVVSGEDGEDEEDADDEFEEEAEEPSGGRLRPIVLGLSLVAAVALIRRKLQSSEDEWEPIEEFETEDEDDDEFGGGFGSDDEDEDEEADADEDDEDEEAEAEEEEAE